MFTTSSFAGNDIWISAKPINEIKEVSYECSKFDLSKLKVYLTANPIPSSKVYFYSVIYYYDNLGPVHYIAREDILKKLVFILYYPGEKIKSQFYGSGFVPIISAWENTSFYYVFKASTCTQLKKCHFIYGFSSDTNLSDFKGAAFTFK
jgi:hypothetical protein